ncbi:MAG TPA: DR2241 family protein [Candidatus Dormibacteraeota bacterium]|nr:DR2241 family protein [Candidatus Dormibacteraeota bacterium]
MALEHPPLKAFLVQLGDSCLFGQVLIQRREGGFELRHVADRERAPDSLRSVAVPQLRPLAQHTAAGAFRPLKAAPNLVPGWRTPVEGQLDLEFALDQLYPGALADWQAARQTHPPITHFREFVQRQSGMYRITAMLSEAQASRIIRACCPARFCLKRRLWTGGGVGADSVGSKSLIPCLEPCAVFLEFARKAARVDQEEAAGGAVGPAESEIALAASAEAVRTEPAREADFNDPTNPRRLALAEEKARDLAAGTLTKRC